MTASVNQLKPLIRDGKCLGHNVPQWINSRSIAQNSAESIAVPAKATAVRLTASVLTYVNFRATATVPTDVDDGTASMALMAGIAQFLSLDGSDITAISFITADAGGAKIDACFFY